MILFFFFSTYNKMWAHAHLDLTSLLAQEMPEMPSPLEKDRVVFFQRVATLYVRYVQIFRRLESGYDQMVHPQKRRILRQLLDGVIGRVLELKNEMVEKECSEYHYMDDIVQDLKLTPADIEIPIPRYFINERTKVLHERGQILSAILDRMGLQTKPKTAVVRPLSLEEAIKLIQVSERARQGRLRAKFMREIRRDEERQRRAKERGTVGADLDQAATHIQKVWKGFIQRKKTRKERDDEMIFIGMALGPQHIQPCPATVAARSTEEHRQHRQAEHEREYQMALVSVKDKLREVEGPDMRETMKDQIRQWFIECHDLTGTFPEYPDEEDGGSAVIFAEKTPKQLQEELAAQEAEKENAQKSKGKKEKKADKGKKGKGKGKGEEEEEPGLKMAPSAFLPEVANNHKIYKTVWQNRDESTNFNQKHVEELIKEEKRKEIESEIRVQVDELMREELKNLRLAVDRDSGTKGKGGKKKKKGKKSGKKKKKEKDLTPDRTIQSLYQELVEQGILKQAEKVTLDEYLGDYSYLGTTLRQTDIEPMPSLSDVRQVISLYAVLPLGSSVVHEKAPLVKSILLAGPAGVGKKMLVNAICTETGANLFDLSPMNIAGKYPGKNGLQMMLHLVFKVARQLQPSVVWIGEAEKMFYKKVPKDEKELDPKRLKKDLPKILKSIKGEDRVLIVGTSKQPFNGDLKPLCKAYNKIILIPRPDYASRYVIWAQLIQKNGGVITSALNLSSLAKISDGYTQGHIMKVVKAVLTERRIDQLAKKPLTGAEYVVHLAKIDPVFKEEEEAFKSWYAKTPLGKKRAMAALGKDEEEVEKGKEKGKGGKKEK
ncbi:dynein regulatory complex protein 11 isoform X1 [Acipenser oxyrinchus oxyrinchus]|uniref:Dynein regulatory complex protein 11 isoform X1 n=1 Tax=Acipenser oxyrinchus oxyrinchus TaxID=40147 RepID=A0AAD8GGR9_ACIOX|nr:dynein regulatory complex protein 11 isoform X1 [Acipenser oxyrinchus oxyrinchus]